MANEGWLPTKINDLGEQHLLRQLRTCPTAGGKFYADGRTVLNFSSNDYLDFSHRAEIATCAGKAIAATGCGAGASRLVTGNLPLHLRLEEAVARHKGYPAALTFGSGYLTNIGVIPALVGRDDWIFADRLVHASIIDGIKLSGANLARFNHNDANHLEQLIRSRYDRGRKLIITESVFSMDGDIAPLAEIVGLATAHDAMVLVDEAHATGIFGRHGSGLIDRAGLSREINIAMGTFSKALGNYGGFVACSENMRTWLINSARSFIYTTALPPAVTAGCLSAIDILEKEPDLGAELLRRAAEFREKLRAGGLDVGNSQSQIIPVIVGDSELALSISRALWEQGILATAIRPPTVPRNAARLRLSVTLAHSSDDLERAAKIICRTIQQS